MIARLKPAATIAMIVGSITLAAQTQQPPAPVGQAPQGQPGAPGPGRGRGGGGFRQPDPFDFDTDFHDHGAWVSLFDGKSLNGWSGDSNWKVEDGAITIESSCEKPTGTIYLVWQGGEISDFELKMRMKGTGNINSGVQYRSWIAPMPQRGQRPGSPGVPGGAPGQTATATPQGGAPGGAPGAARQNAPGAAPQGPPPGGPGGRGNQGPCPSGAPRGTPPDPKSEEQWNMWGPQYDFDAANHYTGQFYEQLTGRGIIAWKGQIVRTETGKNPRLLATVGDQAAVDAIYKPNEYNELHIIAIGNQMTHVLNGRVISILIDEDAAKSHRSGKIGIEVESTGKIFVKDIWLKKL